MLKAEDIQWVQACVHQRILRWFATRSNLDKDDAREMAQWANGLYPSSILQPPGATKKGAGKRGRYPFSGFFPEAYPLGETSTEKGCVPFISFTQ